jgi:ABC-type transporter Mla MlaB component
MLRTMINDSPFEQKWILQGRLCGQWAVDLKERWEETRSARAGRRCVVDLEDVISVDHTGESLLLQMATEGARLIAHRAYMKYILAGLDVQHGAAEPCAALVSREEQT